MRAAKTDATHAEVRDALRACGALVSDTAKVGRGFPDLVVYWRGRVVLVEVKTAEGKLRGKSQKEFAAIWPVTILRSAEEAYVFCGVKSVRAGYVPRSQWETGS